MSIWRAFYRPGNKPNFGIILLLSSMVCALAPSLASADQEAEVINKVKAAFVLNVARFVTWPTEVFEDKDTRLMLCYYRSNPFDDGLHSIMGKTVAGRQLEIKQIEQLSAAESCQILLVSQSELDNFFREVKTDLPPFLLTVTDRTSAAPDSNTASPKGIIVTLVRKGAQIGFEIDLSMSRIAGLKMSSQMLKHARIVGEGS